MQQFVVPQFIDVEDKIFGPITIRQFIILLFGGLLIFLAFRYGDLSLFITTAVIVGGLSLTFAFIKVNGQTFHYFLLNITQTAKKPSLRIWNKNYTKKELEFYRKEASDFEPIEHIETKEVKRDRIRDLALLVNTGGFYRPDEYS